MKGREHLSKGSTSYMHILFSFCLLAVCYYFLQMKRSSNQRSLKIKFNIKKSLFFSLVKYEIDRVICSDLLPIYRCMQCMHLIYLQQSHWGMRTVISQHLQLFCVSLVSFLSCMSKLPKLHSSHPWLLIKKIPLYAFLKLTIITKFFYF